MLPPSHHYLLLLGACFIIVSCEPSEPLLELDSVQPNYAPTDRSTTLQIRGQFYAPVGADLSSGQQHLLDDFEVRLSGISLTDVRLFSESRLTAVVPARFELGEHDLLVRDPLGREAELRNAVEVIPPDSSRPHIEIVGYSSGDHVEAGSSFAVLYHVTDQPPGRVRYVEWAMGGAVNDQEEINLDSPLEEMSGVINVEVPLSPVVRPIIILITAEDDAVSPNEGSARLDLLVDVCRYDDECDDSRPCNGVEQCIDGGCEAGQALDCDDGIDCTDDLCDEGTGECHHVAFNERCADLSFCNGEEICDLSLGCIPGRSPCDDGIDCTVDRCEEGPSPDERGECSSTPSDELCQDESFCNGIEQCDRERGCVLGRNPCADNHECTVEECYEDPPYCEIVLVHESCDDGEECTIDRCVKSEGCVHRPGVEDYSSPMSCIDGIDNDCDGLRDRSDPGCIGA